MKKLRDCVVLLVVAVSFVISLDLLRGAVGFASPWFALMVMFSFLGLVAFAQPLFLLKLPDFLRKERKWETEGRLYEAIGVPAFGALLRRTPLRHLNPLVYLKQCSDFSIVQARIEAAEEAHILAGALLTPYIAYACVHRQWSAVASTVVVQIGVNLYPILHLRWSRFRINRLRGRMAFGRHSPTDYSLKGSA